MSRWIGNSWSKIGNYVPHPEPRYTPDGYHRCEQCNRLMKDGRECDCMTMDDRAEAREVKVRKCCSNDSGEKTTKGMSNAGMEHSDAADDVVLDGRGVRTDAGVPDRVAECQEQPQALKPCPFCGKSYLTMRFGYGKHKVMCMTCRTVYGPPGHTDEQAREAWNRRLA